MQILGMCHLLVLPYSFLLTCHLLHICQVVYINGRPFVLRDVEKPFTNLEYTGINRVRVEQMEARLKEDILMEASR